MQLYFLLATLIAIIICGYIVGLLLLEVNTDRCKLPIYILLAQEIEVRVWHNKRKDCDEKDH